MINTLDKYKIVQITDRVFWKNSHKEFEDANIYQTWNFARIAQNEKTVEHIAIYRNNDLVSLATIRIKTVPLINRGIAYIFRGPVWRRKETESNLDTLNDIFELLRQEYVVKRKLTLRIRPFIFSDQPFYNGFNPGPFYKRTKADHPYNTLILYLDKDLSEIRESLNRRWRRGLNKAERKSLEVIEGLDPGLYPALIQVYHNMHDRKKYKEYVDVENVGKMNDDLPEDYKLVTFVAMQDGAPIAALTGSALGDTGIGLLGGITETAMKNQASYLLYWEMIKWFKNFGCKRFDLGGVDPQGNPGVYYFKQGISELASSEIGLFEARGSYLTQVLVKTGEILRKVILIIESIRLFE